MAPKSKFTKEQIIDAAFDIARVEGLDSITIRKVAERLGSSIAPIYVNFKEVDELVEAVVRKTFAVGRELLAQQQSGHPFYDIGAASIRFAKDYSVLFRDLVMRKNGHLDGQEEEMSILVELMKQDPDLEGLADEELMALLLKMKIFQTGLSVMVASDQLPNDFDEEKTMRLFNGTATDLIAAARLRRTGIGKRQ